MSNGLQKVLKDQIDLLLFRSIRPDLKTYGLHYIAWGLFITWLVGVGRYWDHPNADTWQYFGLGSVAYVFILAALLWLIVMPLRPANWSYRNVLIFVMLTSLPALLYAIPVEKFMSLAAAQTANVWFLAIVALWRVALFCKYLYKAAKLSELASLVGTILPITLIVAALVVLNLEKVTFQLMGGIRNPTQNDSAYAVLVLISTLSILLSPALLIGYGVLVWQAWRKKAENP